MREERKKRGQAVVPDKACADESFIALFFLSARLESYYSESHVKRKAEAGMKGSGMKSPSGTTLTLAVFASCFRYRL